VREAGVKVPQGFDACTRCGLCLQACPTYRDLGAEADSPRGRIFLMKAVVDGVAEVDANLAEHLSTCLGCRACETACPSGVPFGRLLEYGRSTVEAHGAIDSSRAGWRLFRRIAFEWLLPRRLLFSIAMAPAVWLARHPRMSRALRQLPFMPRRLRALLEMLPDAPNEDASSRASEVAEPPGARRARVAIFSGCVMSLLFSHVNAALVRVLRRQGFETVTPAGQWCCGALNLHAGERERALAMARRNIDVFERAAVDAIVVDSAGCGATLKEYGELLEGDPAYAQRAHALASKVKDASEFLCDAGLRTGFRPLQRRVTLQDACHLAHGQRIRRQPRELLRAAGAQLVEMDGADRCCGAAGVYSLTHPEMAGRILDEKLASVLATGAREVVVTNPGCHMQLLAGLRRRGADVEVRHLVELLDEACGSSAE